jgi:hypothetical protein
MRRPALEPLPGDALWPVVRDERPWGLPAAFWNFATPWGIVRLYGHAGERTLYQLWWWSRRPQWWIEDHARLLDAWLQERVRDAHEERIARTRRNRQ